MILGKLYLLIGFTGSGKSVLTRKLIDKNNHLVFDINNEYNLPTDNKLPKSRFIGDYEDFVQLATKKKNTFVVFEDATGFFDGRVDKETRRLIVKKRHQNNNYIFIFHAIHQVPKGILHHTNYVAIFKTNDILRDVEHKFPKFVDAFKKVNSADTPNFKPVILKLQ